MEETQVRGELFAVKDAVEQLTGLPSRWRGGVVLLVADQLVALKGKLILAEKRVICDILINSAVVTYPARWRTYIHEMLHSVSVGVTEQDYGRFRGWEEGVVEQMQRLLRPQILQMIGVDVSEVAFTAVEEQWFYN